MRNKSLVQVTRVALTTTPGIRPLYLAFLFLVLAASAAQAQYRPTISAIPDQHFSVNNYTDAVFLVDDIDTADPASLTVGVSFTNLQTWTTNPVVVTPVAYDSADHRIRTIPSFRASGRHPAYAYEVWANRGTSSSPVSLPVAVFRSEALNDGIVRSGGASNPSGANAIRAGESAVPAQQKGVISFDTSSLGSGITLLAAKLGLKQSSLSSDYDAGLGNCTVEAATDHFGSSTTLAAEDFSASTGVVGNVGSAFASVGGETWAVPLLNSDGLGKVSATGHSQFRLSFTSIATANKFVGWYGGDTSGKEPELIVR